jgi:hypothetical protein
MANPPKTSKPKEGERHDDGKAPDLRQEPPPPHEDDPSRDKTEMDGSVIQPLPGAD